MLRPRRTRFALAGCLLALALALAACAGPRVVPGGDAVARDNAATPDTAAVPDAPAPFDAGKPVLDAGMPPLDAGMPPRDGGVPTSDGGFCGDAHVGPTAADVMTVATAGPGGTLAVGAPCDPANNQCARGTICCTRCCVPSATPVCTVPDRDGRCPLPDVHIDPDYLRTSIRFERRTFSSTACEISERCVAGPGSRRLLHFGMRIMNTGTADMHIGPADRSNPNFNFVNCHGHVHYEGYGEYRLLGTDACTVAARGHKNGYCVIDVSNVEPGAPRSGYSCSNMGISRGWADVYGVGTACQWIDITDVPPGNYLIEARVNPEFNIPESNFVNNRILVPVTIPPETGPIPGGDGGAGDAGPTPGLTDPCTQTGPRRDCGWTVVGTRACTAGEMVTVGCNAGCMPAIGSCTGDPMIRVCVAPGGACSAATALASVDDSCGNLCASTTVVCPATGQITIMTGAYATGAYTCNLEVR